LKKSAMYLVIFLTISACNTSSAKSATPEWCEEQWAVDSAETYEQASPDYQVLLQKWQQLSDKCSGTVAYEARLAVVYVSLNQIDKAREVLKPILNRPSKYSYLAEFVSLHVDAVEFEKNGQLNDDNMRLLEQKYLGFVKKYPDFIEGYGALGNAQAFLGKHNEAVKSLEKALETTMNKSGLYRNLTISYAAVGRYEDALQSADKAYEQNNKLTSDPFFVYALVKTDAALGDFQSAQSALKVIAAKVPEVKNTPEFADAANFVINEIDKKIKK
jgi:tetratricopeptide (TPR) repeat protein